MKLVKWIALTHTPSTNLINIPSKIVRDMGIEADENVAIEYDDNTKILTVKKIKEQDDE